MPHVAGHSDEPDEYADYEVQVIYNQTRLKGDPDSEVDDVYEYEPVSDRGIDSDELAELVAMARQINVYIDGEEDNTQTQVGDGFGEAGLGINLSQTEFQEQSNNNNGGTLVLDTAGDGSAESVAVNNYSEPGILDSVGPLVVAPGAAPTTDQDITSGSNGVHHETFINFRDHFGTGPFIDRTDDLTAHVEGQKRNVSASLNVEVSWRLYWNVEEMPEGRASFARP